MQLTTRGNGWLPIREVVPWVGRRASPQHSPAKERIRICLGCIPLAMAQHSEPWCLAGRERQNQTFGQDRCLSIPSPCKAFIKQGRFWFIAAALRAGLCQQSGTIAFAEQEPLYVRPSACLPSPRISISFP